jgi:hypothetical protein
MSLSYRSRFGRKLAQLTIIVSGLSLDSIAVDAEVAKTPATSIVKPQTLSSPKVPVLDTLIVPGKRVGAITSNTTATALANIFGKQRLTSKKVYGAEGQVEFAGTLITLGKNRALTVVWKDAKKLQPLWVIIADPTFKTAEGIGIGTSLTKLRQVLGEFKITGLGWDYGNQVVDLPPAIQTRYRGLDISVSPDPVAANRFPRDLQAVSGDAVTPRASDPRWKSLKMHVSSLSVTFTEPKSGK